MPGARCARGLACSKKTRELVTTVTPDSPGIPRAMVLTGSFELSPVIGLCCHRRQPQCESIVANLMPASRHQDHTTSPSATGAFVLCTVASTASCAQRFVTIAKRPLCPGNLAERANGRLSQNRPLLELSP